MSSSKAPPPRRRHATHSAVVLPTKPRRLFWDPWTELEWRRTERSLKRWLLEHVSPLGAYLSEWELARLSRACAIVRFTAGKPIPESPFYVVLEGEISVLSSDGEELLVRDSGSFFTRLAGQGNVSSVQGHELGAVGGKDGAPAARRFSHVMLGAADDGPAPSVSKLPLDKSMSRRRMSGKPGNGRRGSGRETQLFGKVSGRLLLVSSLDQLDNFIELDCSAQGREGFASIVSLNLATVLSGVPFIRRAGLTDRSLRKLAEICHYLTLPEHEYVFRQGAPASAFYILLKGSAEVVIDEHALTGSFGKGAAEVHSVEEVHGRTRTAGETMGVTSLVLNAPFFHYGMWCKERTLLLVVPYDRFRTFLDAHPSLQEGLEAHTKRFLVERYASLRTSIFHALSPEALDAVAVKAQFRFVKAGEVVYRAGDAASTFFVVAHGELRRKYMQQRTSGTEEEEGAWSSLFGNSFSSSTQQHPGGQSGSGKPPQLLRVGSYFGEVGLLLPSTQMLATVTANGDTTLLALDKKNFFECIGGNQRLLLELCIKLQRRELVPLELMLMDDVPGRQCAHKVWVDFALQYCRGGLRLPVHNAAATLLRKAKLVSQAERSDAFRPTTAADAVHELLFPLGKVLVQLLERLRCPEGLSREDWRAATAEHERAKQRGFLRRFSQGVLNEEDVAAALEASEPATPVGVGASPPDERPPLRPPPSPAPSLGPLSIFTPPSGWARLWTPQGDTQEHAPAASDHDVGGAESVGSASGLARFVTGDEEPKWKERLKELDKVLLEVRQAEECLKKAIDKGGDSFDDVQAQLTAVCSHHQSLLRVAHAAFVESEAFTRLLETMGQYDQNVQARVKPEELRPIQQRLVDSADAVTCELRSSQSEKELARQMALSPMRTSPERRSPESGGMPSRLSQRRPSVTRVSMSGTMRKAKRTSKERLGEPSAMARQHV